MCSWYRTNAATAHTRPVGMSRIPAPAPSTAETNVTWFGVTEGAWFKTHCVTRTEMRGMTNRIRGPARKSSRLPLVRTSSTEYAIVFPSALLPARDRTARLTLRPRVIERLVQVLGAPDDELLRGDRALEEPRHTPLGGQSQCLREVPEERPVAPDQSQALPDDLACVEQQGSFGRAEQDCRPAGTEQVD